MDTVLQTGGGPAPVAPVGASRTVARGAGRDPGRLASDPRSPERTGAAAADRATRDATVRISAEAAVLAARAGRGGAAREEIPLAPAPPPVAPSRRPADAALETRRRQVARFAEAARTGRDPGGFRAIA